MGKKADALFKNLALGIALFLMNMASVFAQTQASFKWSAYQSVGKYSQAVFLFNDSNTKGMLVKYNSKLSNRVSKYSLFVYDSLLQFKFKTNFTLLRFKESILDIWYFRNDIYLLTQASLPNQRVALRLRQLKTDSMQQEVNFTDLVVLNKDHYSSLTAFYSSRNDTGLIVWYGNSQTRRHENKNLSILTYDYGMNLKDKSLVDLPVQSELCKIVKIEPLADAKFLIYTKQYFVRAIEKRGFSPNFNYVFYLANPSIEAMSAVVLPHKNTFMDRFRLKMKNGILEATGFYAHQFEGPKIGFRVFRYDFNLASTRLDTMHAFDKNISSLKTNRVKSSFFRKSKLESFYLDYFIKINDTDRLVVAEQFMVLPASIGSSYTYNRFYGDILLLYFNTKGEILSAKRLLKAQETYNNFGEFSSYYIERDDLNFSFFYNSKSNRDSNTRTKPLIWHKQSSLIVSKVNAGSIQMHCAATYASVDGIIQVRDMLKLSKQNYLVYAYKHKKGKLGLMTY